MKKTILNLMLISLVSIFIYSCGFSNVENREATVEDSPEAYLEQIVSIQAPVIQGIFDLNESYNSENKDDILDTYDELIETVTDANRKIQKLDCYEKNDCELLDAAQNLFEYYEEIVMFDMKEMVELVYNDYAEFTVEDYTRMEKKVANFTKNEEFLDAKFLAAQQLFASKHGFNLLENEFRDEIDAL